MNAVSLPPLPRFTLPTTAENLRSLLLAILIHVVAIGMMFVGVWFSLPEPMPDAGEQSVVMIDLPRAPMSKPVSAPKPTPTPAPPAPAPRVVEVPKPEVPKPKVEPVKVPPQPVGKPDDVTDQRITPPKIDIDPIAKALEEQQRKQKLEEQRRQQLEEIRAQRAVIEAERIQREKELQTVRERQAIQQELEQTARDAAAARERQRIAEEEAALRGSIETDDLRAQWYSAIKSSIDWRAPEGTPRGLRCNVRISMIVGGEVVGRAIMPPCSFPQELQESLLAAIDGASPLPYVGFESVFTPVISMGADSTDMRE